MTPEQILFDLYKPTDLAIGRSQITNDTTTEGFKVKLKYWTERRQATVKDFKDHLDKHIGMGLAPIHSNSTCSWGAIDVDDYTGDIQELAVRIILMFPFVTIVRSKSGGMHIYVFLDDFYPATQLVPELSRIASALGYSRSEIFPKQTKVNTDGGTADCGNWLNLPYFGGSSSTSYALNKNGNAIDNIETFAARVEENRVSIHTLGSHNPPNLDTGDFADGPPCLQAIWANGVDTQRNISLSNAAVYLKKKYPEEWKDKLLEYNQKMANPLQEKEIINTIIKSHENKDYRYQCKQQPLCQFCHVAECKKRDFGIGASSAFLKGNRSLTKVDTDPPVWYLDVEAKSDTKRINLTTDELQNPRLFQKRCMETTNTMPAIAKPLEWSQTVNDLLDHVHVITIAHNDTPLGRVEELLYAYLDNRPLDSNPEQLFRDIPYASGPVIYFKLHGFIKYLEFHKFKHFSHSELVALLKTQIGANSTTTRVGERIIRVWSIPADQVEALPETYNVTTIEEDSPF